MAADFLIRPADADDALAMMALLPRLASFELPPGRKPKDLWRHDKALLETWLAGEAPDCLVHVAMSKDDALWGLVVTTLRPELLSGAPSAHLEAIVVDGAAEGKGVASALIETTETAARARGAESITLHVFGLNKRARNVYARAGYTEELIRCSKPL